MTRSSAARAHSDDQLSFLSTPPPPPSSAPVIWSDYQKKIFRFAAEERRNGLIIARAGTGKTRTLIEINKHLPQGGERLLCAFNTIIAQELSRRCPDIQARTMHSLGLAALRRHWGINAIHPSPDKDRRTIEEHVPGWVEKDHRTEILRLVRMAKAHLAWSDEELKAVASYFRITIPWETYRREGRLPPGAKDQDLYCWVRTCLDEACQPSVEVSYDDMVYVPARQGMPVASADVLLVDEAQDLTTAQIRMLSSMIRRGGRIIAVGDPAQAIYQFRGADQHSVTEINNRFDTQVLSLPLSYRCAKSIVDLAQSVAPDIEALPDAPMGTVRFGSLEDLADEVAPGDMVVSRINAPLVDHCLDTIMKGKSAHIRGKDLGAGLTRLVSESKVGSIQEFQGWLSKWSAAEGLRLLAASKQDQAETLYDRVSTMEHLCRGLRTTNELRMRIAKLFGDDVTGGVQFSSTHRAKGLEANRVFMLENTYKRYIPGEEANLWYVAVTRARNELVRLGGEGL